MITAELEAEREDKFTRAERLKVLESELDGMKIERDAQEKELVEARQVLGELKEQQNAKARKFQKVLESETRKRKR